MEEELTLDNILDTESIDNLFVDQGTDTKPSETDVSSDTKDTEPEVEPGDKKESKKNKETIEDVNTENLFVDTPESVDSEESDKEKGDTDTDKSDGTTPKKNFFSSTAKAFAEEGIFPDLNSEELDKVTSAEEFKALMEKQMKSGLTSMQKRVADAIEAGVDNSDIKRYENTFKYLDSIQDEDLNEESDNGENLRKQLIFQDFVNRGFSKERAQKEVERSLNSGNDIEDAKDALLSNKDYFKKSYDSIVAEAKAKENKALEERKIQAKKLKTSILEEAKVFGDIDVDKATRAKVYDNISKPIYTNPDTGEALTAIQKYEMENKTDFLKNVGLLFTLTDGFKNVGGLVKGKVKKEVKKGLRELEHTLNNTARTSSGGLNYASGVGTDPESHIGVDWDLDV